MAPHPGPHESTLTPRKRPDDLDTVLAKRVSHARSASAREKALLALQYEEETPVVSMVTEKRTISMNEKTSQDS